MSTRIRQLEDALAILQASVADERHPLLSDELLKLKFGGEALEHKPPPEPEGERSTKEAIDALGTLALGEDGNVTYFGRSAGSETLMMAEAGEDTDEGEHEEYQDILLPPEIEHLSGTMSLLATRRPNARALVLLETALPDRVRALALCESYLDHATFFFRPVKREQLLEQLLPNTYDTAHAKAQARAANGGGGVGESTGALDVDESAYPHALASLFFIFSLGALFDVTLPPYNAQAEHFYHMGRAALSLRKSCPPTLETVQAVGLMATYHSLAGKKYSRDSAWWIMSLAAKLAQSYGLHRDSARWNLDPETVQRRRNLFWEIFSADVSHSLAMGRPPAIHLSYVDCEYPEDKEATLSDSGEIQSGFWKLKHDYARDIFYCVAEATLSAQTPSYKIILDLDKKVREMSFPTSLKPYLSPTDGEEMYYSSSLSIRDFYASQNRTVIMIYLHRSFFAQAMLDHPTNPLQSTFAPSFLTAYRCASIIIKATAHQFDRCEELAKRIWFLMYHTFSAAVIVGTIVTRCPNSSMAANALKDLDMAVLLFRKAAPQSQRARIALAVLKRLHDKATKIFSARSTDASSSAPEEALDESETMGDIDLAIFGGQARVLTKRTRHRDSITKRASSSPSNSSEEQWNGASPTPHAAVFPTSEIRQDLGLFAAPLPQIPPANEQGQVAFTQFEHGLQTPRPQSRGQAFPSAHDASSSYTEFLTSGSSPRAYMPPQNQPQPQQRRSSGWDPATAWAAQWEPIPSSSSSSSSFTPTPSTSNADITADWTADFLGGTSNYHQQNESGGDVHMANATLYSGSDGVQSTGVGLPAYQYDLQENVALLSSFGLISQNLKDGGRGANGVQVSSGSGGGGPSALVGGQDAEAGVEGDVDVDVEREVRAQMLNPGAVELGLSGESRLDAGWLAFMRDCGILGSPDPGLGS